MEIEKKYLVNCMPENLDRFARLEIEQGYICRKPTIRIRKSNDDYILTYKARITGKTLKTLIVNDEREMPLNAVAYRHLREKIDGYIISKTRYLIPLPGGLIAELDVFHDRLEGLIVVEVEFPSELAAKEFTPPSWFGQNVSDLKMYTNGHLSELASWAVETLPR